MSRTDDRALQFGLGLVDRFRVGSLTLTLPDGTRRVFRHAEPGPDADLTLHRGRTIRRFLLRGNLGFNEAYLDGDWTSTDLEALFRYFLLNAEAMRQAMLGKPWRRLLSQILHLMRPNSRSGARKNIAAHYDLGNAFYEKWLDPSMTYSAALYREGDQGGEADAEATLIAAQEEKYRALADRLDLTDAHHVLEIGCGWGGFAEFAARERGARVTAITISPSQFEYARQRLFTRGLADKVDVRLQDYRDVEGRYDRLASIEMFEAVGEKYWPAFFDTMRRRLNPGGAAGLQVITIADEHFEDYRRSPDYIQHYVFPGGMLPSRTKLREQVTRAGLHLRDVSGFGGHYARTLRHWNARFQAAWPEIRPLGFDDRFKRMWEQYLMYCAAGFSVGTIDVVQAVVGRD